MLDIRGYAKVEKVNNLYVQTALQVRVDSTKVTRKPGTVEGTFPGSVACLDTNFKDNNELEWVFVWNNDTNTHARDSIIVYGVMKRVTITDPRPVGWSGDGGVRESNKVELIKSGGGSRRGRSPLSPS